MRRLSFGLPTLTPLKRFRASVVEGGVARLNLSQKMKKEHLKFVLIAIIAMALLNSCSDRLFNCPAYNSYPKRNR